MQDAADEEKKLNESLGGKNNPYRIGPKKVETTVKIKKSELESLL